MMISFPQWILLAWVEFLQLKPLEFKKSDKQVSLVLLALIVEVKETGANGIMIVESRNHKMVWVGRDGVPTPLPWAAAPSTRSGPCPVPNVCFTQGNTAIDNNINYMGNRCNNYFPGMSICEISWLSDFASPLKEKHTISSLWIF